MPTTNADTLTVPVLGFAAWSGTGKTTLLKQLLPLLQNEGVRVGMIKHAHHDFDIDHPGKDSYELRKAGARQMLIASARRWALMVENKDRQADPVLGELLSHLDTDRLDLILVEGFKHEAIPKIELHRRNVDKPWLYPDDPDILAVACDGPAPGDCALPQLDLNQPAVIARFILENMLGRAAPALDGVECE